MSRRKTIEDCKRVAKERGGICLSTKYKNSKIKLKWKCADEHIFCATFNDILYSGSWCPECRNIKSALRIKEYNRRKQNEIVNNLEQIAKNNNGKLLSDKFEYKCAAGKLLWECSKGHQFWSSWLQVGTMGQWCPRCSYNKRKVTIQEVRSLIKLNGGNLLSTKYTNNKEKLSIICKNGHTFLMSYGSVKGGNWCPKCAGLRKKTIDDAIKLAEAKGGYCLSDKYINSRTKMLWKCKNGHTWEATYCSINNGTWCKECCGTKRKTIKDAINLAYDNGGYCLSDRYINSGSKLKWKCKNGHVWCSQYNTIRDGHWCPICSGNINQTKIYNMIREIFKTKVEFNYRGFKWLKYKTVMEIDIWLPELKLAIEYDGEQHFKPVRFGGISERRAKIKFSETIKRDRFKNSEILKHPEDVKYFVRFNYMEDITKEYVINKLRNIGVSI